MNSRFSSIRKIKLRNRTTEHFVSNNIVGVFREALNVCRKVEYTELKTLAADVK